MTFITSRATAQSFLLFTIAIATFACSSFGCSSSEVFPPTIEKHKRFGWGDIDTAADHLNEVSESVNQWGTVSVSGPKLERPSDRFEFAPDISDQQLLDAAGQREVSAADSLARALIAGLEARVSETGVALPALGSAAPSTRPSAADRLGPTTQPSLADVGTTLRNNIRVAASSRFELGLHSALSKPNDEFVSTRYMIFTVNCNPGWRTAHGGYAGRVDVQLKLQLDGKDSEDLAEFVTITAVYPAFEAQHADLRSARSEYFELAAALAYGGAAGTGEVFANFAERLGNQSASASSFAKVTSFSTGTNFGYDFRPGFDANIRPGNGKPRSGFRLDAVTFPALAVINVDVEAIHANNDVRKLAADDAVTALAIVLNFHVPKVADPARPGSVKPDFANFTSDKQNSAIDDFFSKVENSPAESESLASLARQFYHDGGPVPGIFADPLLQKDTVQFFQEKSYPTSSSFLRVSTQKLYDLSREASTRVLRRDLTFNLRQRHSWRSLGLNGESQFAHQFTKPLHHVQRRTRNAYLVGRARDILELEEEDPGEEAENGTKSDEASKLAINHLRAEADSLASVLGFDESSISIGPFLQPAKTSKSPKIIQVTPPALLVPTSDASQPRLVMFKAESIPANPAVTNVELYEVSNGVVSNTKVPNGATLDPNVTVDNLIGVLVTPPPPFKPLPQIRTFVIKATVPGGSTVTVTSPPFVVVSTSGNNTQLSIERENGQIQRIAIPNELLPANRTSADIAEFIELIESLQPVIKKPLIDVQTEKDGD